MTLLLLVGIPGSGKSTYVKNILSKQKPQAIIISSDETRNQHPSWNEDLIWNDIYLNLAINLKDHDVIFDATNVTVALRKKLFDNIEKYGVNFDKVAYVFKPDGKLSYDRISLRNQDSNERFFPLELIDYYVNSFEMPRLDEGFSKINIIE